MEREVENMKKNMKILFVANDSVNYGSSKSMINLINEFKKHGLDITVLIPQKGPLEQELENRNITYRIYRYFSWVNDMENKPSKIKIYLKKIFNQVQSFIISFWVKKEGFNIIHSVNSAVYIGALVSKKTRIKHIWHIRELMEEDHNLEFFDKKYALKLLNEADKLICISKVVKEKYEKYLNPEKLVLVYNGIPIKEYHNEKIRNKKNFKILIAGNISKTKGQKEAVEAVEILINNNIKNIKLLIAGNGVYENDLRKYVKAHKLEQYVEFLGFVNNLNKIREDINIALVCSKNEAFGRVTVESMMSKNLVIGANTGGTIELIKNKKYGFLYNQGSSKDLSEKIKYCMENWDKCIEIINAAYQYSIENFSIERCADEIYKIYNKI